jgi:iron-sulfur cluster assembly protein
MLTVSEAAAEAINSLVNQYRMPEGAGLRISRQGDATSTRSEGLGVSLAAAPAEDDAVIESHGVRIFLPPNMIKVLHDQELDVERVTEDGEERLSFTVDRRRAKPQG